MKLRTQARWERQLLGKDILHPKHPAYNSPSGPRPVCKPRLSSPIMGQVRQCQGSEAISRNEKQDIFESIRLKGDFSSFYYLSFVTSDIVSRNKQSVTVLIQLPGAN